MYQEYQDISLVFCGAAGQGVQTITSALLVVLKKYGYNVFSCTEYMSRIRGGSNTTEIRITEKREMPMYNASICSLLSLITLLHI